MNEQKLVGHQPMQMYKRYGGVWQSCPLTDEEKEYDKTCQAIDYAQNEILKKPLSLFMAGEFMWFNLFVNKMFFFPKQQQLDRQLIQLGELLKTLDSRELKATSDYPLSKNVPQK